MRLVFECVDDGLVPLYGVALVEFGLVSFSVVVLRSDGALVRFAGVVVAVPARVGDLESNNRDIVAGGFCISDTSCVVCALSRFGSFSTTLFPAGCNNRDVVSPMQDTAIQMAHVLFGLGTGFCFHFKIA